MLDKEYKYYLAHEEEFKKKYSGKVIVIVGESVVGVYDDESTAYEESVKKHNTGSFLLQYCDPQKEPPVQTFRSRVSFS